MPMGWVAAIGAIAGAGGSASQADSAKSAAGAQAAAAKQGATNTLAMYQQNKRDLAPWVSTGEGALADLNLAMGKVSDVNITTDPRYQKIYDKLYQEADLNHQQTQGGRTLAQAQQIDPTSYNNLVQILTRAAHDTFSTQFPGSAQAQTSNPNFGILTRQPTMDELSLDPAFGVINKRQQESIVNNAAALGGIGGGNTLKELIDYASGSASAEYGQAYGRRTGFLDTLFNRLTSMSGTGANTAGMTAGLGANAGLAAGNFGVDAANAYAAGRIGSTNALVNGGNSVANNYMMYQMMQNNKGNNTTTATDWNSAGAGDIPTGTMT